MPSSGESRVFCSNHLAKSQLSIDLDWSASVSISSSSALASRGMPSGAGRLFGVAALSYRRVAPPDVGTSFLGDAGSTAHQPAPHEPLHPPLHRSTPAFLLAYESSPSPLVYDILLETCPTIDPSESTTNAQPPDPGHHCRLEPSPYRRLEQRPPADLRAWT